jgi:hypothetical protein
MYGLKMCIGYICLMYGQRQAFVKTGKTSRSVNVWNFLNIFLTLLEKVLQTQKGLSSVEKIKLQSDINCT